MSKILLTGMTAPQSSQKANAKALSFAGVLFKALTEDGDIVVWQDPSVKMTLEDLSTYDHVVVGLSPLGSIGANRVYGALHLINMLWDDPRLIMLIDSPQVKQLGASLRSAKTNPESITKDFYSYRKEYALVAASDSLKQTMYNAIDKLLDQKWPTTIFPCLPWKHTLSGLHSKLPGGAAASLYGINLDAFILEAVPETHSDKREKWVADTYVTDWAKATVATLALPNFPMKWNKGTSDDDVFDQITRSIGVLITPHKGEGTWWTYRYVQALNAGVPIATDWKESSPLGEPWTLLASSIESMSQQKRDLIAMAQRDRYVAVIGTKKSSLVTLKKLMNKKGQ